MSSPSSRTVPSARAPRMTSCMRLSERSTVDLPQPDEPMNAVTLLRSTVMLTSFTAWNPP